MKYIVVTGGVLSGVGKGIIASSTAVLIQSMGYNVYPIKIDPYINVDAGTISPGDHGEVFVLSDGTECDLDLGNYERFLDVDLKGSQNITTGKIFSEIITKERNGEYLGKTVQMIPHVTNLIKSKISFLSTDENDVCIIELGGTVGDIESTIFIEALRQLKLDAGRNNFLVIAVEHIPELDELKTKPVQNSAKNARSMGIAPNIIVCRCNKDIEGIRSKVHRFCEVDIDDIYWIKDVNCIYEIPSVMKKQSFINSLTKHLNLENRHVFDVDTRFKGLFGTKHEDTLKVAIVGKYLTTADCYLSIINALKFSAAHLKINIDIEITEKSTGDWDAIIIPGGFGIRGCDNMLQAAKFARENQVPFLGICLGFQIAVIEFCRNVLKIENANSEEFEVENKNNVIIFMPEVDKIKMGATMRLGARETLFVGESRIKELYGNSDSVMERHRHRYEVNEKFVKQIEMGGLKFVGKDTEGKRMQIFEFNEGNYVGVQFHPEFSARPTAPHCLFTNLLECALKRNMKR